MKAIGISVVVQRLRRRLRRSGESFRVARGAYTYDLGRFCVVVPDGFLAFKMGNLLELEEYAREPGARRVDEEMAVSP